MFERKLGDPFVSQNTREFYASYSVGLNYYHYLLIHFFLFLAHNLNEISYSDNSQSKAYNCKVKQIIYFFQIFKI